MACPPQSYCKAPGCEDSTRQGRTYCEFHEKRKQRCECLSLAVCQCLTAPKQERLSPKARLLEAALRYADAEDDVDFSKAERDLLRAARQAGSSTTGDLVRHGHAEARRRGVRIGRPPEVDPEVAHAAVTREGSITAAARVLGKSRPALYRALARVTKDGVSLRISKAA